MPSSFPLFVMNQQIFQTQSNSHFQYDIVRNEYEVKDAFIGIIPCDNGLTSEALLGYIKDIMMTL